MEERVDSSSGVRGLEPRRAEATQSSPGCVSGVVTDRSSRVPQMYPDPSSLLPQLSVMGTDGIRSQLREHSPMGPAT